MSQWLLPTLSEILREADSWPELCSISATLSTARQRAEWGWSGAIVALGQLLQGQVAYSVEPESAWESVSGVVETDREPSSPMDCTPQQGVILCGPLPLFTDPEVLRPFANWIFIPDLLAGYLHPFPQLLPGSIAEDTWDLTPTPLLPLLPDDPLAMEQFCLVLTQGFALVLVIGDDRYGLPHFQFSFEAQVLTRCCDTLLQRIALTGLPQGERLAKAMQGFPVQDPDFRVVSQFTRLFLDTVHLPIQSSESRVASDRDGSDRPPKVRGLNDRPLPDLNLGNEDKAGDIEETAFSPDLAESLGTPPFADREDVELLQAIAHEVRTPLATIRTLTRLLLKRQDLAPAVMQRLQTIDQECTEQIDRFGLIFRAAELETTTRSSLELVPTFLEIVFQHSIPRWQKQADRRHLGLQVSLPEQLPTVFSDPALLDQVLTGLVDRFIRHLPPHSQIYVTVSVAGDQLKLQLQSQLPADFLPEENTESMLPGLADEAADAWRSQPFAHIPFSQQFQALGNLLLFQPETGRLSLNLEVTKNLFQAIGGKLIIREKVDQGEILTVFLPLEPFPD